MPKLIVTTRDGTTREVAATFGHSVMAIIRDTCFDEVVGLCGGCCACATCHVHVDARWASGLPPMHEAEENLLASCGSRNEFSRLACQIPFTAAMDGMRVQMALED